MEPPHAIGFLSILGGLACSIAADPHLGILGQAQVAAPRPAGNACFCFLMALSSAFHGVWAMCIITKERGWRCSLATASISSLMACAV